MSKQKANLVVDRACLKYNGAEFLIERDPTTGSLLLTGLGDGLTATELREISDQIDMLEKGEWRI